MIFLSAWNHKATEITITGTVFEKSSNTPLSGVKVVEKGTANFTTTDVKGWYTIKIHNGSSILIFSRNGYQPREIKTGSTYYLNVGLEPVKVKDEDVSELPASIPKESKRMAYGQGALSMKSSASYNAMDAQPYYQPFNTEDYSPIEENIFHKALNSPLSTFAIDVDAASYSNMRRFISNGQLPPKDAVRIEEMINYFHYDYPQPTGEDPFSINTELARCPWNENHWLVQIGLQGKKIPS